MIKTNNTIKIFILVFFSFVLFSVTEGYICKYYGEPQHLEKIKDNSYLPHYCVDIFKNYWNENGIIEYSQVALLILAIYLFFSVRKFFYENDKFIYYLIIIKIIGLTYFLGEEMSWGQHIFKWESPDFFMNLNNQKEENLHNMSNFFDQIPRSLVLLWCCFSIITIKFVNKLRKVNKFLFIFINPNRNILLISLLLIFFLAPDFIIDKFDLHPGYKDSLSYDQIIFDLKKGLFSTYMHDSLFYDLISFKFIRLSELHELIIAFYFFIHSYSLKKEIRTVH
mgnify:FL=1